MTVLTMTVLNIRSVCIGILATMTMDVLSVTALKLASSHLCHPRDGAVVCGDGSGSILAQ